MSESQDDASSAAGDAVGSVAEEAVKLLGALSGWAREQGEGLSGPAGMADGAAEKLDEHLATGTPECTWCPVCRTVHAIRQTSPEVRAHLASAASSLMLAVSEMMATRPPSSEPGGVQRIELDADDWPEEGPP